VYHYEDAIMKAYSPKNYKRKWANNANKDTIDSLKYLPKHVDKLVIASGKKDGLIFATHGYHQVSFLSETVIPAKLEELLVRCDKVYAWLDCDAPGIAATEKLIEKYPMIEPIHWKSKQKDISDFSKHNNFNITKNLLESNLGKPSFVWEHSSTGMSRCFV
jgi:DNA primase